MAFTLYNSSPWSIPGAKFAATKKLVNAPFPKPNVVTRRHVLLLLHLALPSFPIDSLKAFGAETGGRNSIEHIKEMIKQDIEKGQYYVTGDLTKNIYSEECRFIDPTTDVVGVEKYVAAVRALFDPTASKHELLSIQVMDPNTIRAKWRLQGYLKFPWRPHIEPYEGTTTYVVGKDGLIEKHEETWDISVLTAFLEFLTPSFNAER